MTEQEYKHIRNLAWDLLIDANISALPVDINPIAKLYHAQSLIKASNSLYDNALLVSSHILSILGYNNVELSRYLAVRILSPMIILKALNVESAEDVAKFTKLPINIAKQRFDRFQMLLKRNAFETSKLETKVLNQFKDWLYNNHN